MFDKSFSSDAAIAASQSFREREYWLKKLSGELIKSCFPYDNKESAYQRGEKDRVEIHFSGELFSRLIAISNRSDTRLLTVLAAGLLVLINKYTGSRDIIIGMPIYKQKVEGDFINTALALRCHLQEDMTFKDLLYRVKQTIDEAIKHQNYPIKTLLYDLNLTFSQEDFPLFDILLICVIYPPIWSSSFLDTRNTWHWWFDTIPSFMTGRLLKGLSVIFLTC